MKRIFRLALALVFALSLVFAVSCGDKKEEDKEPGDVTEQQPSPEDPDQNQNEGNQSGNEDVEDPEPPEDEPELPEDDGWVSAIFGGGPFVTGGMKVAEDLKASGFDTVIIWSVHVHMDGTLYLNDIEVCDNGVLTASQESLEMWASLKQGETSIRRIELSVGAAECADFEGIRDYIARDGTGEDTVLYKNMKALIDATGADAVNYDDESCYDVESAVAFGKMCDKMGVKVTFCPYVNDNFWGQVKDGLGDIVDRVYVQCYSGGTLNNSKKWMQIWELSSKMKVIPGYWCGTGLGKTPASSIELNMEAYLEHITGGFIWFYDDLQKLSSPNSTKDYAEAIENAKPSDEEQ